MKTAKVLEQLKQALGRDFVAGGKFAPQGVVAGMAVGGAVGSVVAAKVGRDAARRTGGVELPRVLYLALTEADVYLVEGRYGITVSPKRVITSWPRSSVKATRTRGVRNVALELEIEGVPQPVKLLYGRGDSSAEGVVELLGG